MQKIQQHRVKYDVQMEKECQECEALRKRLTKTITEVIQKAIGGVESRDIATYN